MTPTSIHLHRHVLRYSLFILQNSHGKVFALPDCASVMVEQMQMFRDRADIFEPCCATVMLLVAAPERRHALKAQLGLVDRICSISSLMEVCFLFTNSIN